MPLGAALRRFIRLGFLIADGCRIVALMREVRDADSRPLRDLKPGMMGHAHAPNDSGRRFADARRKR